VVHGGRGGLLIHQPGQGEAGGGVVDTRGVQGALPAESGEQRFAEQAAVAGTELAMGAEEGGQMGIQRLVPGHDGAGFLPEAEQPVDLAEGGAGVLRHGGMLAGGAPDAKRQAVHGLRLTAAAPCR
jgi:hypothetical protein